MASLDDLNAAVDELTATVSAATGSNATGAVSVDNAPVKLNG